jgi:hypothetical protein
MLLNLPGYDKIEWCPGGAGTSLALLNYFTLTTCLQINQAWPLEQALAMANLL